jgi:hypothetical protein
MTLPTFDDWATCEEATSGERFKHCEIEINTACDLACFACDRFSDLKQIWTPNMTVSQVRRFVEESFDLNWEWERIRFLGGEPTLHPHFEELIGLLVEYRRRFPRVFLQVLTNGRGKSAQYMRMCRDLNISLHAETKTEGVDPPWFNNTRIVPVDRDPNCGEMPPCSIFGLRGCGIALTRHGYFLDGAGASAARVAGHDVGKMHLSEVTWQSMLEQARVLCRICGHHNPCNPKTGESEKISRNVSETGHVTGLYWTRKLAEYAKQRPPMRIYGEDE